LNKESTLLTAKGIRYFNERFRTKVQSLYPEEELPPEAIGTCLHLDLIARSKAGMLKMHPVKICFKSVPVVVRISVRIGYCTTTAERCLYCDDMMIEKVMLLLLLLLMIAMLLIDILTTVTYCYSY